METRKIFIVNAALHTFVAEVKEKEWEEGMFTASISHFRKDLLVLVCRGGWNEFTNCAGFATSKEVNKFRQIVINARREVWSSEEISERLQKQFLGRCRDCRYENKHGQFIEQGYTCPVCGNKDIVFA